MTGKRPGPRLYALVLASLAFFAGCAPSSAENEPTPRPVSVTIAVPKGAGDAALDAAGLLAGELGSLSGGGISAEVVQARDISLELRRGTELIFMDNSVMTSYVPFLGMLSAEFLFTGYEHMSMSLNSSETLEVISAPMRESTGYIPAAALYSGSKAILSKVMLYDAEDFSGTVSSTADSGLSELFMQLCLVNELDRPADIADEEISWITVSPSDGTPPPGFDKAFYFIKSNHQTEVSWLLVKEDFYSSLDDAGSAALAEAAAAASDRYDSLYLKLESDYEQKISDADLWIYGYYFEDMRSVFLERYRQANASSPSYNEWLYYKIDALAGQ